VELAELAIAGGADTIQFRQKDGATRQMIRVAEQMQALCKRAGVTFITFCVIPVFLGLSGSVRIPSGRLSLHLRNSGKKDTHEVV